MRLLLSLSLFLHLIPSAAQSPRTTVTALFDGMRAGDTTGMQALFHPDVTLRSVTTDTVGRTVVVDGNIPDWLLGVARARRGMLDEQLHYVQLRTDGDMATAWTPYTFVLNGEVHHCGTNSFQLVRDGPGGAWRILNIVDTRRTQNCTPPAPATPPQQIDSLATRWHRAAARADSAAYFGMMTDEAVYIGTDPSEHWTKQEFATFAGPYFAAGEAWDFTATERHIFHEAGENIAYFDELLDTWMGACRGTGIVKRGDDGRWKIAHYTLSVAVPNEVVRPYLELLEP